MSMNAEGCQLLGTCLPTTFRHHCALVPVEKVSGSIHRNNATKSLFQLKIRSGGQGCSFASVKVQNTIDLGRRFEMYFLVPHSVSDTTATLWINRRSTTLWRRTV